jgi:hypothetical protein
MGVDLAWEVQRWFRHRVELGDLRICQVSCYAASLGISRSTSRKNRVLRARDFNLRPATI